jgi:hypothetical protein
MDKDYNMRELVIEHNIRTENGDLSGLPVILPASDWGDDWDNLHEGVEDEVGRTDEDMEGITPKDNIPIWYSRTFIRTAKDDYTLMREYWFKQ